MKTKTISLVAIICLSCIVTITTYGQDLTYNVIKSYSAYSSPFAGISNDDQFILSENYGFISLVNISTRNEIELPGAGIKGIIIGYGFSRYNDSLAILTTDSKNNFYGSLFNVTARQLVKSEKLVIPKNASKIEAQVIFQSLPQYKTFKSNHTPIDISEGFEKTCRQIKVVHKFVNITRPMLIINNNGQEISYEVKGSTCGVSLNAISDDCAVIIGQMVCSDSTLLFYIDINKIILAKSEESEQLIKKYTDLINSEPSNSTHYFNRGVALNSAGKSAKALEDFSSAIKLNPKFADAYIWRAQIYLILGDPDKVISNCTEVIKFAPENVQAYLLTGLANEGKNNNIKAVECYTKAIGLNPEFGQAYYRRGLISLKDGNYDKAHEDIYTARQNGVSIDGYSYNLLAVYALKEGNLDDASRFSLFATKLTPDNANAWYNLGIAYLTKTPQSELNYEDVQYYFETAMNLDPGNETYKAFYSQAKQAAQEKTDAEIQQYRSSKWYNSIDFSGISNSIIQGTNSVPSTPKSNYGDELYKAQMQKWYNEWYPNSYNPYR